MGIKDSFKSKESNKKPISYWTFLVVLLMMAFFSQFTDNPIQLSDNLIRDFFG